ncbi:helicase HerA-like domain-containing protein [Peptoniphilus timonensis]|uniref:helicase HerA-like domain-containing protein n=1 Tax=Peptoniphilus timonensis TaxID=1268254 RepID=UPI0003062F06|nr:helicase HerA-like domain-containing protein [Peptoniphilus timonensis]
MDKILIGKGKNENYILLNKINRHGLISGATGTGKTVTLKVLTEALSDAGVPTILADVKGDLANISKAGKINEKLQERLNFLGLADFEFKNYPVNLWDIYGEKGIPLRVTVSEMGPLMLSNILGLNDTQSGVLNIIFKVADSEGLLLIDLKDLKELINYVSENRDEISKTYGNVASQSLSAISRKLLYVEDAGGELFFGEPALNINDLLRTDATGKGFVNIINANKLISNPLLYSMLLLYLLSEIYETFPEVGDLDKPKLVFFFDEAHLLFNNTPNILKEKIIQVVRLIRSKGVGVFFITQDPLDIPEEVSSQLSNRIIHQLRAFSPKELKTIKTVADTFRQDDSIDLKEAIINLRTGEAIVSFADESGAPTVADKSMILAPHSSFDALSDLEYRNLVETSDLYNKYKDVYDRESAYEILKERFEREKIAKEREEELAKREKELEKERKQHANKKSYVDKGIDSMLGTITRSIGREIARGILGSIKKKR